MDTPLVFIFRGCPPQRFHELKKWGIVLVSLSSCPGVERVEEWRLREYIKDKFVVVVGDRLLAKRLEVAHATYGEVERFMEYLKRDVGPLYKPYLQ